MTFFAESGGSLPDEGMVFYGLYVSSTSSDPLILPPSPTWDRKTSISLQGYKVRGIRIWFSPGCGNWVQIRFHYNQTPWLPDPVKDYSDYYQGDGLLLYIPANRVIDNNDVVDVYYKNSDTSSHTIDVKFEMVGEREWESKTPQDLLVESGRGNLVNTSSYGVKEEAQIREPEPVLVEKIAPELVKPEVVAPEQIKPEMVYEKPKTVVAKKPKQIEIPRRPKQQILEPKMKKPKLIKPPQTKTVRTPTPFLPPPPMFRQPAKTTPKLPSSNIPVLLRKPANKKEEVTLKPVVQTQLKPGVQKQTQQKTSVAPKNAVTSPKISQKTPVTSQKTSIKPTNFKPFVARKLSPDEQKRLYRLYRT